MIIGTIKVEGTSLTADRTDIGYQYSENLQLQIEFGDTKYLEYTLLWYFSNDSEMRFTGGLDYDPSTKRVTLTREAFMNAGRILISFRAVKTNEAVASDYVVLNIGISANPDMVSIKADPNWEKTAMNLIRDVYEKDYKAMTENLLRSTEQSLTALKTKATTDLNDLKKSAENSFNNLTMNTSNNIKDILTSNEGKIERYITKADNDLSIMSRSAQQRVDDALAELGDIASDFVDLKHRTPYVYDNEEMLVNADDIPEGSYAFTFGKDDADDGGSKAWMVALPENAPDIEEQLTLANGMIASKMGYFGGGGGGGSALPTIKSEFAQETCKKGEVIEIPFFFQSPNIGRGKVYMSINGKNAKTDTIKVGNNTVATPPMEKGSNVIKLYVTDAANLPSNELSFSVECGALEITSLFDGNKDYSVGESVNYAYNVECITDEEITALLILDGTEYRTKAAKGYNTFVIPSRLSGVHPFSVSVYTDTMQSNVLEYNLVMLDSNSLHVSTTFTDCNAEEGKRITFDYRISMRNTDEFDVSYLLDGAVTKKVTGKNGINYMILNELPGGQHRIGVTVSTKDGVHVSTVERNVNIIPSQYQKIEPVKNGLVAWYKMADGDNAASDRDVLADKSGKGNNGTLHNFNFSTNGYFDSALKMNGLAYAEIPVQPFASNAEYGLTIDIQFNMRDIGDSDAKVLYCKDSNKPYTGIEINTLNATMASIKQSLRTVVSNDAKTRITYVIDRENKLMSIYVNAVRCEIALLSDIGNVLESFKNSESIVLNGYVDPVSGEIIHQGSCEIYNLRVYDRALSDEEVLQNHISDIEDRKEQQEHYDLNYSDSMSTMYFTGDMEGMGKKDAKEISIRYMPSGGEHGQAFDLKKCKVTFQGTSSLQYPVKNYKIKLYDDFGNKYKYSPFGEDTIKESTFTLKADMMSSAHFENTGGARMINDAPYKELTPAKQHNEAVRHSINGFPIQLYVNGEFAGVYNFNNDKGNTDTFGLDTEAFPGCISYEVAANSDTTAGAFCKWTPETGISELEYLQTDFELRYPDEDDVGSDYGYMTKLKRLVDWVSDASDEEFKAHLHEYMNVEYTIFYFLQVLVFGMVDNLGKNMMLTTWDGNIWYPQFYDLDTQMGLNNTGRITFDSDIEMQAGTFNTSASKLWTKLQRNFDTEIKARYAELRADYFTMSNIMKYLNDDIVAQIGERQYNMDAEAKYINHKEYLFMAHGSRIEYVKRWMEERILYLDSKFDYQAQIGKSITVRVNKQGEVYFDLKTYSPQYVKVRWRNNSEEIKRIGRDETVRFSYTMPTATDQEVIIYNAPFIKSLGDLTTMSPTEILIESASKLTELTCTGAKALGSITLPKNSFMQRIDISGCSKLGASQSGVTGMSVLNVSECVNLKYLDARDTSLTSIVTNPLGGNLQYIFYPWTIQEIDLRNQYALKAAIIPYDQDNGLYSAVSDVTMINCPLLVAMTSPGDIYKTMSPISKAVNVEIRNTGFPDMHYTSSDSKEYGVRRLAGSLSPGWERCVKMGNVTWYGKDTNLEAGIPVHFMTEVNADVEEKYSNVRNDFDNIAPWSKIKDNVEIAGRIMVEIPKFYVKHIIEDGYEYWWISEKMKAGYHVSHPFVKKDGTEYSRFLMGKYFVSRDDRNDSKPAAPFLWFNNNYSKEYYENIFNIGKGWHATMYDEYTDMLIPLFLVEFATSNSEKIVKGLTRKGKFLDRYEIMIATENKEFVYIKEISNLYKMILKADQNNFFASYSDDSNNYFRVKKIEKAYEISDRCLKVTLDGFKGSAEVGKYLEMVGPEWATTCFTGVTESFKEPSISVVYTKTPTGFKEDANIDYYYVLGFKYRGIENIFGSIATCVSNITKDYKCFEFYEDFGNELEYFDIELKECDGYISQYKQGEKEWILLPSEINGTSTSGYCDKVSIIKANNEIGIGGGFLHSEEGKNKLNSENGIFSLSNNSLTSSLRLSLSIDQEDS